MKKTKIIVTFLLFFAMIITLFTSLDEIDARAEQVIEPPSLDFHVEPEKKEFLKPPGEAGQELSTWATGKMKINLNPLGSIDPNQLRKPVDVVFVFDKSGSMANSNKIKKARDAMDEALKVFGDDKLPNDRFGLVTFDSEVRNVVPLTNKLEDIKSGVDATIASGGTNYTQSLESARELLVSNSSDKYVIFLTDGQPTNSQAMKDVSGVFKPRNCFIFCSTTSIKDNVKVYFDSNGETRSHTAIFNYRNRTYDYTDYIVTDKTIASAIKNQALNEAQNLANGNIKLYSIGFGSDTEVDMKYLAELSTKTASKAYQGNSENLNEVFRAITNAIRQKSITDIKVKINISDGVDSNNNKINSFPGAVKLQDEKVAYMEDNQKYAVVNLENVPYFVNKVASTSISGEMPLAFSSVGTYKFNDIQLVYKDLSGNTVTKKHAPVEVIVKNKIAPDFKSSIAYVDPGSVGKLTKYGDKNGLSNQFKVNYTLTPNSNLEPGDVGRLTDIKISQPLPSGVTVVDPPSNVQVVGNGMEITFGKIDYQNQKFNYEQGNYSINVTLQANWALMQKLQDPFLTYNATSDQALNNFGKQSVILTAPSQDIVARVILDDSDDRYVGDYAGNIEKLEKLSNKRIDSIKLKKDNSEINQPIMSMVFNDNNKNVILVTYSNGDSKSIALAPQFIMKESEKGIIVPDGSIANDYIKIKLTDLVLGKDVKYQYSITDGIIGNIVNLNWNSITPEDEIFINKTGTFTIRVKAVGGFAKKDVVVVQSVTVKLKSLKGIKFKKDIYTIKVGDTLVVEDMLDYDPFDAPNKEIADVVAKLKEYVEVTKDDKGKWVIKGTNLGYSDITATAKAKDSDGNEIKDSTTVMIKRSDPENRNEKPTGKW